MLDKLREQIKAIDSRIAELVSERLELAGKIGRHKQQDGLPVRDYGVEKAVLERMHRRAAELKVDPEVLEEIALALIKGAVNTQLRGRQRVRVDGDKLCTIIGGGGQMGGWFERFVASLGYATRIVEQDGTIDEQVAQSDLVILAVPLAAMRDVLAETLALQPQGIVLEIASLKSHLTDLIEDAVARGLQVASIHPMFGPDTDLLAGQNVVVCQAGCAVAENTAVDLFCDTAANLTELPLAEHDRYMTWVLNLPHLVNLAMGETLRGSGMSYPQLLALGGTTFGEQMKVTAKVMSENPLLYYHIQNINRHRDELYAALSDSVSRIGELSAAADSGAFAGMMKNWLDYAGSDDDPR